MKRQKSNFILEVEAVESLPPGNISTTAKFLYSAMRRRWGYDKRQTNVSSGTIIEELGMNPHSYQKAYKELKKAGLINRKYIDGWGWSFLFPKVSSSGNTGELTQVTALGNWGGEEGGVKGSAARPVNKREGVQEKEKDRKIEKEASKDIGCAGAVVENLDGLAGDLADLFGAVDSKRHREATKWIRKMLEHDQAEVQPWLPLAIENTKRQIEKEAVFSPTGWLRTLWVNREQDIARAGLRKQAERHREDTPKSAPEKLKAFQAIAKEMGGYGSSFLNGKYANTQLITPDFKKPRIEANFDIGPGCGGATGGTAQVDVTEWTTEQFRQAFGAKRAKVTKMPERGGVDTISDLMRESFPQAMPFG